MKKWLAEEYHFLGQYWTLLCWCCTECPRIWFHSWKWGLSSSQCRYPPQNSIGKRPRTP